MKSMTTKLMITAAALAIGTGAATAQMKAEIPFAFRAGEKVMSPGVYTVRVDPAYHFLIISSNETTQSTILLTGVLIDPSKEWTANGKPVLAFACGVSRCELSKLWTGPGKSAMAFSHRTLGHDERASIIEVRLSKVNGD